MWMFLSNFIPDARKPALQKHQAWKIKDQCQAVGMGLKTQSREQLTSDCFWINGLRWVSDEVSCDVASRQSKHDGITRRWSSHLPPQLSWLKSPRACHLHQAPHCCCPHTHTHTMPQSLMHHCFWTTRREKEIRKADHFKIVFHNWNRNFWKKRETKVQQFNVVLMNKLNDNKD